MDKLAIGCDHGGFRLKEELKPFIESAGFEVIDFGCFSEESVDYPDFAFLIAASVAKQEVKFGIMIDGVGVGSTILANKVPGVRAALCNEIFSAFNARAHNDANMLCMGGKVIGLNVAKEIVKTFLKTEHEGGRHKRRVDKITNIEKSILNFSAGKGTLEILGKSPQPQVELSLITEEKALDIVKDKISTLTLAKSAIVTPLAMDILRAHNIKVRRV